MSPELTPADALVAAAVLANWANHPGGVPTWAGIAQRLSEWANTHPAAPIPSENEPQRSDAALNPDQVNLALTKEV